MFDQTRSAAIRLYHRLAPPPPAHAAKPETPLWLIYVGFLFIPVAEGWNPHWLLPTLGSLPVFFLLFFRNYRHPDGASMADTLALVLLGCALLPFNPFANAYLLYACGFSAYLSTGIKGPMAFTCTVMTVYAAEVLLLRQPAYLIAMTALLSIPSCLGNAYQLQQQRSNAALRISQDEVRRLAATAERERIGRDLHDLLGHTLSLIAVKLELADRLLDRNPDAGRHELRHAREIARDALAQVRSAVTGYRSGGLAAELASSRLMLETCQIAFSCERDEQALAPEIETAVAMIVREAATNIQRHARARNAAIRIHREDSLLSIDIDDDGSGGIRTEGNGLSGMRERIGALGGSLALDSPRGGGTHLRIRLPLQDQLEPAA